MYCSASTFSSRADSPVLIDNIWQSGPSLIVLGTATGVFASISDYGRTGRWFRVGLCSELPMVFLNPCSLHTESCLIALSNASSGDGSGCFLRSLLRHSCCRDFWTWYLLLFSFFCLCDVTFQQASTHSHLPSMRLPSKLPAKHLDHAAANPQRNLHRQRHGFLNKRVVTRNPTNVNHFYSSMAVFGTIGSNGTQDAGLYA
jgi:hypothetical protein